jgi:hypothetical protein
MTIVSRLARPMIALLLVTCASMECWSAVPDDSADTSQGAPASQDKFGEARTRIPSTFIHSRGELGKPQLLIQDFDVATGLLAAYQSASGKRILIKGWSPSNGVFMAEAVHVNAGGDVEVLVGRSREVDPVTGVRRDSYVAAGVDVLAYVKAHAKDHVPSADNALGKFVLSEEGQAFSQAVPALYTAMESLPEDASLVGLPGMLGATLTALQLVTGIHAGFDEADQVIGVDKANALRSACKGDCRLRGKYFTVHSTGLFDILAKVPPDKKASSVNVFKSLSALNATREIPSTFGSSFLKNGDGSCTDPGPCFGSCGPGCINPGDIASDRCLGHDACQCAFGWTACVNSCPENVIYVPDIGFVNCSALVDAIIEYLAKMSDKYVRFPEMEYSDYDWWDWGPDDE